MFLNKGDLTKIGLNNITDRFNIYLISSVAPSAFKLGLIYDEYTFIDNTSINKYHSIYLFNSVDGKGSELGTHSPFQ